MIKGKYICFDGPETEEAFKIRETVFSASSLPNIDALDEISLHGVVYFNETIPVATGRITYLDGKYIMSKIAVLPEFQNKKIGDFLVRMLVDKVFCSGAKEVYTDSTLNVVGFFEKLGFTNCSDEYEKDEIRYQPMKLNLKDFRTGCGHAYCPAINQ